MILPVMVFVSPDDNEQKNNNERNIIARLIMLPPHEPSEVDEKHRAQKQATDYQNRFEKLGLPSQKGFDRRQVDFHDSRLRERK